MVLYRMESIGPTEFLQKRCPNLGIVRFLVCIFIIIKEYQQDGAKAGGARSLFQPYERLRDGTSWVNRERQRTILICHCSSPEEEYVSEPSPVG